MHEKIQSPLSKLDQYSINNNHNNMATQCARYRNEKRGNKRNMDDVACKSPASLAADSSLNIRVSRSRRHLGVGNSQQPDGHIAGQLIMFHDSSHIWEECGLEVRGQRSEISHDEASSRYTSQVYSVLRMQISAEVHSVGCPGK